MGSKNQHINEEQFKRYLVDGMSGKERHEFERLLQKHPFEAEALEGMLSVSHSDLNADLNELKEKINPQKKRSYPYWIAAASFLIIASLGILFYMNQQIPMKQVAEVKVEKKAKPLEIEPETELEEAVIHEKPPTSVSDPAPGKEKALDKQTLPASEAIPKKKADEASVKPLQPVAKKSESMPTNPKKDDLNNITEIKSHEEAEESAKSLNIVEAEAQRENNIVQYSALSKKAPHKRFVEGTIVSSEDGQPLPGATVLVKGTTKGTITDLQGKFNLEEPFDTNTTFTATFVGMEGKDFKLTKDSENVIKIEPSQLAVQEVVVVGYGTKHKNDLTGSVSEVKAIPNGEVQPQGGFEEYEKYLQEKCIIPEGIEVIKKVVKIVLSIDSTGTIIKIAPTNSPDSILLEIAKKIIHDGPGWQPEVKDGKGIPSEIDLKLKFSN